MKRVVAAVGVCAVGVTGLQGQNVTGLSSQEAKKSWNLSASLRGFYDDNSLLQTDENKEGSFGIEFSPGVSVNLPLDRTLFAASYRMALNYYEARPENNVDQDHAIDLRFNHKFSERYNIETKDTFVYADAPEVLDHDSNQTTIDRERQDMSGFRNHSLIDFNARLAPSIGTSIGYKNNLRDYSEAGFTNSLSALLDQMEHLVHVDGQWFPAPHTTLFIGYQIGLVNYTSDDSLGTRMVEVSGVDGNGNPATALVSENVAPESRNNLSHYLYVGGRREFSRKLYGAASFGIQYADFYNEEETSLSPYIDLTGTYAYLPGCDARLGLTVQRNSTDSGLGSDGSLTLDQESLSVYTGVNHRITPRINGAIMARYQHSIYNGGEFDGEADDFFTFDSKVSYKIRENLYAEAGYVWMRAASSRPDSGYNRNRVYVGIRAAF
jgi:hypothetical protein